MNKEKSIIYVDFYEDRSASIINFGALQKIFSNAHVQYFNFANKDCVGLIENSKLNDAYDFAVLAVTPSSGSQPNIDIIKNNLRDTSLMTGMGNIINRSSVVCLSDKDYFDTQISTPGKLDFNLIKCIGKQIEIPAIIQTINNEEETSEGTETLDEVVCKEKVGVIYTGTKESKPSLVNLNKLFNPAVNFEDSNFSKSSEYPLRIWFEEYVDPLSIVSKNEVFHSNKLRDMILESNAERILYDIDCLQEMLIRDYLIDVFSEALKQNPPMKGSCVERFFDYYAGDNMTAYVEDHLLRAISEKDILKTLKGFNSSSDIVVNVPDYCLKNRISSENVVESKDNKINYALVMSLTNHFSIPKIENTLKEYRPIDRSII